MTNRFVLMEAEVSDDGRVTGVFWREPLTPVSCATCKWAVVPSWDANTSLASPLICHRPLQRGAKVDLADHLFVASDFGCVQWEAK